MYKNPKDLIADFILEGVYTVLARQKVLLLKIASVVCDRLIVNVFGC